MEIVDSSNHGGQMAEILATVVHYTAANAASGSISWLCNPLAGASAHYVIARYGLVTRLVHPEFGAWHAGVSELVMDGEARSNVNEISIGIELANHGRLHRSADDTFWYESGRRLHRYERQQPEFATLRWDTGHEIEGWWEPYGDRQIEALTELLAGLRAEGYNRAVSQLIGHEEIAMPIGRKMDPGPLFPWHLFDRASPRRTAGRVAL